MIAWNSATFRACTFAGLLLTGAVLAAPQASAQMYSMEGERALHPNLTNAERAIQVALRDLINAPEDFGGNKAVAIVDLRRALLSVRRALFFRLRMDDRHLMEMRTP